MQRKNIKRKYSLKDRLYLIEIVKGLVITMRHAIFNFVASLKKGPHTVPTTWQYPEDRREISPIFRGEHMLLLDDKGREKCIGCGMCARGCPAKCIVIKKAKVKEGEEEKYAGKSYSTQFNVDLLRCIFCGFCEEACPKGAIVLGQGYELAKFTREECQLGKAGLIDNFLHAKEKGILKPPKKPVPVVKEEPEEKAEKGKA